MNVIDRFFLWLFLLPERLYKKAGVDVDQLRAVLTAKVTMDNRRPNSFGSNRRRSEKKEINKATITTMFGSLFIGVFLLFSFETGIDMITKLTLFTTMFIFMLCVTLITDFTSVLIDVRDNLIILPKPISDVTFLASRLLHITIRICIVVIPMILPSLIFISITEGIAIILPFLLMIALMTVFSIFLINAIYILILKISTPAKFQSIIGSIQIAFVVLLMAGYQLMPRLVQSSMLSNTSISSIAYIMCFPSYWFADGCLVLTGKVMTSYSIISLVLSLIVPVLSIWLVVRYFAPSFNRKLSMISAGTTEKSTPIKQDTDKRKSIPFLNKLARILTKSDAEYAGFVFTGHMIGRSREYKMKVYPAFGYMIVFGAVLLFQKHGLNEIVTDNKKVMPMLLMIIYISSLFLSTALQQLPYSEKFKASWMFFVTPIKAPGQVICGAVKCVLSFYFLPLVVLIFSLGLILQGPSAIPNLLLGSMNVLIIAVVIAYIMVKNLPFSKLQIGTSGGSTFFRSMILMIIPCAFGLIHWLISGFFWVVLLFILISTVIPWLVFDEIKKQDWGKLYPEEMKD
jgi:ABC-2 type transport system permease protein